MSYNIASPCGQGPTEVLHRPSAGSLSYNELIALLSFTLSSR